MPLINIKTSYQDKLKSEELLREISIGISKLTGKPEKYVMALIETSHSMTFGGSKEDCCYVEIKSIGALRPREMSHEICKIIYEITGISKDRVYISFEDILPNNWGYNGSTFG